MKLLFCILIASLLSCISSKLKIIPIKESYPNIPMVFQSDKSFEQVWDNLIDLFAQKGLSIIIIDKSSGLLISNRSKLASTYEMKNGKLNNPGAL